MADPTPEPSATPSWTRAFASHRRQWQDFHYVYPVLSRRSRGLSVGINLNPSGRCNFDCVYCCVDRRSQPSGRGSSGPDAQVSQGDQGSLSALDRQVDVDVLAHELDRMLHEVATGAIWQEPPFDTVPDAYRRLNDIAFSGNGEPTLSRQFLPACRQVVKLKAKHQFDDVRVVVITNATNLTHPEVEQALSLLDDQGGEVWAKLDAGTAAYFQQINRSSVSFDRVLSQIAACGQRRPVVIQTLLLRYRDQVMGREGIEQYTRRIRELLDQGCQIGRIQLYTIARPTAESQALPLESSELKYYADLVRDRLRELPIEVYDAPRTD